jgi:hypothetical protein
MTNRRFGKQGSSLFCFVAPVLYQFVLVQFTKPNILEVQSMSSGAIILLQH